MREFPSNANMSVAVDGQAVEEGVGLEAVAAAEWVEVGAEGKRGPWDLLSHHLINKEETR
jgi:hypothetical protein